MRSENLKMSGERLHNVLTPTPYFSPLISHVILS
jgi:hypothetical protein